VKRQRRFGTEVEAPAIAAAQIRTLIDSIGHCVQSLNYDIETEEERTRCWDLATRLIQFWREACPPGAIIWLRLLLRYKGGWRTRKL
jgi:hypothetical protein